MSDKDQENVEPEVQAMAEEAECGDASSESATPGVALDELTREAELEAAVADLRDQLLRAVAEQENVRKRADREREQLRKFGISNFAKDLLSVADNLRRALDAGPSDLEDDTNVVVLFFS